MKMRATFLCALCALLTAAACGGSEPAEGCSGDDCSPEDCSPGEEGCACLDEGSCNGGLTCLSALCVDSTAGIGGDSQGTGGDSAGTGGESGGSSTGGGSTGGESSGGMGPGGDGSGGEGSGGEGSGGEGSGGDGAGGSTGGEGSGGAPETGGSGGDGTGGEAGCGDTQTDPNNCGSCGHQCRDYFSSPGSCADGVCGEAHSECFDETVATSVSTCNEYCLSVLGEACVNQGCGGQNWTWRRWDNLLDCTNYSSTGTFSSAGDACSVELPVIDAGEYFRCCCAEAL